MVLRSITPGRPAVWESVGESFVLAQTDGDWDPAAWKEVGQGYSADAPQVLSNRESQDLNYGPVIPGYKAGDVLAFSGRVQNRGAWHDVCFRLPYPCDGSSRWKQDVVLAPAPLEPAASAAGFTAELHGDGGGHCRRQSPS